MIRAFLFFSFGLVILFVNSCKSSLKVDAPLPKAVLQGDSLSRAVIHQCILRHGGDRYDSMQVQFEFRKRTYKAQRNAGQFVYERLFTDSTGAKFHDILTNDGLKRIVDGKERKLPEERRIAFTASVNSVIYFALLPYFLEDPATISKYMGQVTIKENPYHKIGITFQREGGGPEFQDEFIYWIHTKDYTMDYLAYNYQTEGGGARFREAVDAREISGIRFADYINYKPEPETLYIQNFDSLFEAGALKRLSLIRLENVVVQ